MAANMNEKDVEQVVQSGDDSSIRLDEKNIKDVDDAMVFMEANHTGSLSPEEEKKLLRKIDNFFMPMLLVTYTLSFMDKQAMAYSSNFGLLKDNHLTTEQYSWASGSIVNLVILVCQPVVSRLMQVLPLGRLLATTVILWGVILMCTSATRSFAAIMTVRALLGLTESVISPAIVIMTGQWYKRDEQPTRTGYWFMGNAIAQVFGGLIGYGIGHIHHPGVGNWIWYFIIFGAITICWGISMLWLLPDNPMHARWLTQEQRVQAVQRIRENKTGIINHNWKWNQCIECLLDPLPWMLFATILLSAIPSGGVASFGNIVIKGFGFSSLYTTLLQMPLGVIQGISILAGGIITQRFKNCRCHIMALTQVPPLIGSVLLTTLPQHNRGGRLAAYYIIQTHTVNFVMVYSLLTANISGFTKKATAGAMVFIAGAVGQIAGPQLFKGSQAPRYPMAFNAAISCFSILIVLPYMIQGYLMWQNRLRQKSQNSGDETELVDEGLLDLTDHEQKGFRYVY